MRTSSRTPEEARRESERRKAKARALRAAWSGRPIVLSDDDEDLVRIHNPEDDEECGALVTAVLVPTRPGFAAREFLFCDKGHIVGPEEFITARQHPAVSILPACDLSDVWRVEVLR